MSRLVWTGPLTLTLVLWTYLHYRSDRRLVYSSAIYLRPHAGSANNCRSLVMPRRNKPPTAVSVFPMRSAMVATVHP